MTRFEIENHTTRLVANSVMYGESLYNGRFVGYQRSLSGRPCYQGITDPMGEVFIESMIGKYPIESFELEIDGQSLHSGWQWVKAYEVAEEGFTHGVVELKNTVLPVTVLIHSRLDGTAFIERWLEIRNESDKAMKLSKVSPMSGLLWRITDKREHGLPEQFQVISLPHADAGYEGFAQSRLLYSGTTVFESYNGRSGYGVPWFCVRNCVSGEVFVGHLEWSANWQMAFTVIDNPGENEVSLLFSAGPKARAPQRVIEPRETVASPVVHLGHVHGSFDNWVQQTHLHIRNISLKVTRDNLYIGAGRMADGEMDWLEKEVKLSADMGMEYFLLDAGWYTANTPNWFNDTGDWDVLRFGGTLAGVRDMIHKYNMKFGIWLEPESFGKDSKLHKEKPEWSLIRDGHYACSDGRVLDLSRKEVFEYVMNSVFDMFREHRVEMYKIDYNTTDINEHGENMTHSVKENSSYRYVQALYAIYDRIKVEFPGVNLENCAGGGGRNDLGFFRRCHVSCISDYAMFPRSIKALNNLTMALPPERLRFYYRHFPGYHMYGDLETQLRVLMFCVPIFVGFGRDENWVNEYERKIVRQYVDLYKNFVKAVLPEAKVYHHTPALSFKHVEPWCVLEYAACDMGYAGVFRLLDGTGEYRLILRGIKIGREYKVTFMNSGDSDVIQGSMLANIGLTIRLDGALSSEMVLYQCV